METDGQWEGSFCAALKTFNSKGVCILLKNNYKFGVKAKALSSVSGQTSSASSCPQRTKDSLLGQGLKSGRCDPHGVEVACRVQIANPN